MNDEPQDNVPVSIEDETKLAISPDLQALHVNRWHVYTTVTEMRIALGRAVFVGESVVSTKYDVAVYMNIFVAKQFRDFLDTQIKEIEATYGEIRVPEATDTSDKTG